jgi:Dullard-like phosphatase family protein
MPKTSLSIFDGDYRHYHHHSSRFPRLRPEVAIIVDLDETLISSAASNRPYSDFLINVSSGNTTITFSVYKRPYLDSFLAGISRIATVYLYTAADEEYTRQILHHIDPFGRYFAGVFTRKDCIPVGDSKWQKDFTKCGTDMSTTILVDDDLGQFGDYADNGIAVDPFTGHESHAQLPDVLQEINELYQRI